MSTEVTKTYVEFFYPGSFFSESEVKEVKTRSTSLFVPAGAFAFQFYDQSSKKTKINGEEQTVWGKRKNLSGKYYPKGMKFNLEDVRGMGKDYSILASNMECNDWPFVVRTRCGNFQPLEKYDEILP